MPKHSACNLASINLSEFIKSPFTAKAHFNSEDFIKTVKIAVRGLDTVLDENLDNHALPEQRAMAENYRNIGLGIMGLHDALIKLGITYGSPESVQFADQVMGLMFRTAVIASAELAKELGPFPKYSENLFRSDIIQAHFSQAEIEALGLMDCGLRNCSLLSIAPTGSLGTMLNISTGCEPLFALSYTRKTESLNGGEDKYYKVYAGVVDEFCNAGGDADLLPSYFNTSADLKWHDRIDMQSALQKHTDTAISSTINLPEEITVDEIEKLYLYAWEMNLKGVTIFRENCKRLGILTTEPEPKEDIAQDTEQADSPVLKRGDIIDCSDDLIGKKRKLTSGCGSLHCLAYFDPDNGDLQEVYLAKGSTGGCLNSLVGLSRMISLAARAGVDIYTIVDQLDSTGACPSYRARTVTKHDTSKGSCCPMAVGKALLEMWKEVQDELGLDDDPKGVATPKKIAKAVKDTAKYVEHAVVDTKKSDAMPLKKAIEMTKEYKKPVAVVTGRGVFANQDVKKSVALCPDCGEPLRFEGGCNSCPNCGYSKCN